MKDDSSVTLFWLYLFFASSQLLFTLVLCLCLYSCCGTVMTIVQNSFFYCFLESSVSLSILREISVACLCHCHTVPFRFWRTFSNRIRQMQQLLFAGNKLFVSFIFFNCVCVNFKVDESGLSGRRKGQY